MTGEVWWVELASRGGHEQQGRRPIILQTQGASNLLPTVVVVPLTTQLDALRFPGTILIEPTLGNQPLRSSVALVFQITTIDRRNLTNRSGNISAEILAQIFSALDELAGREAS